MLSIEKIAAGAHGKKTRYQITTRTDMGSIKVKNIIATFDSIKEAACVLRFVNGAYIRNEEYDLVLRILGEIDEKESGDDESDSY